MSAVPVLLMSSYLPLTSLHYPLVPLVFLFILSFLIFISCLPNIPFLSSFLYYLFSVIFFKRPPFCLTFPSYPPPPPIFKFFSWFPHIQLLLPLLISLLTSLLVFTGVAAANVVPEDDRAKETHFILVLDWAMNWGTWGPQEFCPVGTFAYAFQIKVTTTRSTA